MSVRALGDGIREGRISPVALAEGYLERAKTIGARLNAFVTVTSELAMKQARQAEAEIKAGRYRGPLHGVPYAVKDLVAVKGYPTTWGAKPYAHQSFDYDATVIERLNEAGAVLLGKAAMIELAGGLGYSSGDASLTGPARNPWNPDCWTCGSSSGSGAIVSAGLAPWALGSDTRGSILCPSSWCGVSGLRPSFGRVSRYGSMAIAYSMDKLGPMARTADDCALVLNVIGGHDPKDHDSVESTAKVFSYKETEPGGAPLRVGRLTNVFARKDSEAERAIDEAAKVFQQAGATVEECEFPDGPFEEAAELTILMEAASAFEHLVQSGDCKGLTDPLGQINGYASEQFSVIDYLHVQRVRTMLQKMADSMFDKYSVLISASQPTTAQPLHAKDEDDPAARRSKRSGGGGFHMDRRAPDGVSSLCGLPAISIPCGFSKAKLPYGMQIMGRALEDATVLKAARLYQTHTEWHLQHPSLS